MLPTLKPEPVDVYFKGKVLRIPREKIAAAYSGAWAAKEGMFREGLPFCPVVTPFKELYNEVMPACIVAANSVGLSAVPETLEHWRPGKHCDTLLRERLEHSDNPWYPFFEDD